MKSILVTGASGFVGQALVSCLKQQNYNIIASQRSATNVSLLDGVRSCLIGNINAQTDWQHALNGIDVVVHLAARVHILRETNIDAWSAFREVNALGTANLARQAAAMGVRRFVFLSSIKVLGESTDSVPFSQHSKPAPMDAYARSKHEAEQLLQKISAETGMEIVIIRPPLVYGAGVKGNFLRLMHCIVKGWPLPFGAINNKRSLIYLENLCDLLVRCVEHPHVAGKSLLVADQSVFSTPQLILHLATQLQSGVRLWSISPVLLRFGVSLLRKEAEWDRLASSLVVDASYTDALLGWEPPFSPAEGIAKTVTSFLS